MACVKKIWRPTRKLTAQQGRGHDMYGRPADRAMCQQGARGYARESCGACERIHVAVWKCWGGPRIRDVATAPVATLCRTRAAGRCFLKGLSDAG